MINRLMKIISRLSRTAGRAESVSDSDFYSIEFPFLIEDE